MMKREAPRGATADRRIALAVAVGMALGLITAIWHVRSAESGGSVGSAEGRPRMQEKIDEVRVKLEQAEIKQAELLARLKQAVQEAGAAGRGEEGALTGADGDEGEGKDGAGSGPGARQLAGPPGTMKGIRCSPPLIPDRSANPHLADILERVAINRELIVGISNINIQAMLQTWFNSIKRLGIQNFLVVALDEQTKKLCEVNDVPVYQQDAKISDAQKGTGENHAISSSKFHLIRDFLVLGYSVFLSDIDVLFLQNPFQGNILYRDADVEGMTDGFTNATAYGWDHVWDDPTMGWSRYTHTMQAFVFNSGLFYIRPTMASLELLDRVAARLAKEKAWDQAVYNEEMFFPSRPSYNGLHISKRVLDYYSFLNSKTLFKEVRKLPRFDNFLPVSLHVNYHPDKYPRMLAAIEKYVNGKKDALDRFPDGSE